MGRLRRRPGSGDLCLVGGWRMHESTAITPAHQATGRIHTCALQATLLELLQALQATTNPRHLAICCRCVCDAAPRHAAPRLSTYTAL